jgi:hypothetical protein
MKSMKFNMPFTDEGLAELGITRKDFEEAKRKIESGEIHVEVIGYDEIEDNDDR